MPRWSLALLLSATALLSSPAARAEDEDPAQRKIEPERRNGVVLGMSGGAAFAGSSGYTNGARFLDNPDYYSSSPLLVGWSGSWFLMGALTDYFSFGPTLTIATFESDQWKSTGWGAGFRGEVFPFVHLLPALADTAIVGQLGVGSTVLRAKGPYPDADGTQSFFGIGAHHEWRLGRFLGGHGAIGPEIDYSLIRSTNIERHWLTIGLRVVWYGGKVKLDQR